MEHASDVGDGQDGTGASTDGGVTVTMAEAEGTTAELHTPASAPSSEPTSGGGGGGVSRAPASAEAVAVSGRYLAEVKTDQEMVARIPAVFTLLCCGCCELCALRYLGHRTFSLYREPLTVLQCLMESLWETLSEDARKALGDKDWRARSDETAAGTCTACLGTLQNARSDSFMQPLLQALSGGTAQYEFYDYSLTITLPASTVTRQYALHYHLLDEHKDIPELKTWDHVVEIKEAIKWILGHELRRLLNLRFSRTSLFHASIKFKHAETDNEHEVLYQIPETNLRQRKKKGGKEESEEASITAVSKALRALPMSVYRKYGNIPPVSVKLPATCELTFFHDSIYISGRYAKFSRELSQSPWTVGTARVSETSVQELITGPLHKYFLSQEMRFSSSGREDIDVRMLGEGRPFVLEIVNPHRVKFTPKDYATMQSEINAATHLVRVRDLQRIEKEDITKIQEGGEEDKRKTYRCVIWLAKSITPADLEPLANIKDLVIEQTTPIRVLHRRTLSVRKRTIYSMRAHYVTSHFCTLDLTTQAGTYVKEFIHGDLGRTRPNLGMLMNCETDILQLDVLAIDLDFPPRLPGQPPVTLLATNLPPAQEATTDASAGEKANSEEQS